tara:strand:+ start:437 stop:2329 length:1893 start_codon:yes stop_codon:yes gene_type:complete
MGDFYNRDGGALTTTTITATTITADDLEVDSGTLSIDETNNRVGMGTTAPGTQLQVESNTPYVTLKNDTSENTAGGCESKIIFEDHANVSLGQIEVSHSGSSDDTKGKMILSTHTGSSLTAAITINDAQKVTAAGDVQVTGDIILDDGGSLKEAGGTAAITFDGSGHVTKIGQDTHTSGQFLKWDGSKAVWDAVATGSSAADDITAGDAAVTIATTTGNITLDAQAGDADIIFKGTDDTSDITALTLDMSEAGAASFNAAVTVGTDLTVTGGDVSYGNGQDATLAVAETSSGTDGRDLTISAGSAPAGATNQNGGDLLLKSGGGDGTGTSMIAFHTKVNGTDAAAERMRIHTDGNVGIGTNAPSQILQVASAAPILVVQNTTNEHTDGGAESKVLFGDHAGNALSQVEGSHSGSSDDAKGQFRVSTNNGSGMQLAMSIDDSQNAVFAGDLTIDGGDATLGTAGNTTATTIQVVTNTSTNVGKSLTIAAGSTTTGANNLNGGDLILKSGGGDGTGTSAMQFHTKISGADTAAERMRINTNGNVVINGSTAHAASLALDGAAAAVALKEMANAPADTAAFGQLWVKTATPNELYFTTDAGDDIQITSGTATAGGGSVTNDDANLILAIQSFL